MIKGIVAFNFYSPPQFNTLSATTDSVCPENHVIPPKKNNLIPPSPQKNTSILPPPEKKIFRHRPSHQAISNE